MIETLTDDSQVLLLYLADELPEGDRQVVERRLLAEPMLKSEFDQLGALQRRLDENLARLDDLNGLPVNERAVVRSVGMEMRKRLAMPRVATVVEPTVAARRWRPWMIPAVVAACVVASAAICIEQVSHSTKPLKMAVLVPTTQLDNQSDDNLALFVGSFRGTDAELADAVGGTNKKDAVSQDDVSQYLLNIGSTQD